MSEFLVIRFSGEDWREWLQGQITQDINLLSEIQPIGFCLCKPTGQLLSFGDLSVEGNEGFAVIPTNSAQAILDRVEQMVILEDCEAEVVSRPDLLPAQKSEWDRLSAFEPKFGVDTNEKTLPPELGPHFEANYLHYNKGCYTGQEVLQRIHSRGHTNRTWTVFRSAEREVLFEGFQLTSVAENEKGEFLVAGFLRNESPIPDGLTPIQP